MIEYVLLLVPTCRDTPTPSGPTLFSATGGNFSAIHVDYVDFVPETGWRFRSRNL